MAELKALNTKDGLEETNSSETTVTSRSNDRGQWGSRVEFLLSLVGYAVGIASIWRFPIVCLRNGGGAFLIPFFLFLVVYGAPLYYMEVYLGQFTGLSPPSAFEMCPLFKGIGWTMVILSFLWMWYIMIMFAWILYFLVHSFNPVLPWTTCDNWWNTRHCRVPTYQSENIGPTNTTDIWTNYTTVTTTSGEVWLGDNVTSQYSTPASEFWTNNVLRQSTSLEDYGTVQWHLVVPLFAAWLIIMLCIIRGVRSLGKVVYVTATLPYVLLTVMFIRGLLLDGCVDGIKLYVTPEFKKLATLQVWIEAAIQAFYSLGPAWGGVITMASYNKFHKKSFWDVTFTVVCDGLTNFYSGLVVFTILGFMSKESGLSIQTIASTQGFGLVFVAYPEAISRLPLPQIWAVLFFIMLVTVIIDTLFCMIETVVSSIIDILPRKVARYKLWITVVVIVIMFILDLPFTTNGSLYLVQLLDWYCAAFGQFVAAGLETIAICWFYGADRFSRDVEMMTGKHITVYMRFMWCYVVPSIVTILFALTVVNFKNPDFGGYTYQPYAIVIGYLFAVSSLVPIFVVMIYQLLTAEGSIIQRFRTTLQPSSKWKPNHSNCEDLYDMEPYTYEDTFLLRRKTDLFGSELNKDIGLREKHTA